MATTITKKPAAVVDKGGNYIINVVLTTTTTNPGFAMPTIADTNTFDLGHVANSSVAQTASKTSFKNEDGESVVSSFEYERVTTGNLMQSDADLINYLGDTVKGVSVLQIKHTGVVNGLDQWHFQVGQVTPQYNISRPGGATSNAYEHTGYDLNSSFEISAANLLAIAVTLSLSTSSFFPTTTVTISASKSYALVEVA
jgi:hypothetical protein